MNTLAFALLVILLIGYVLLDGYDLGMGTLLLFVARNEPERRTALGSIAPFWNGNEVWLITAAAALFAFFPQIYASAFSGFYLPLMIVLWLLMGRGIAFELRELIEHPLWHDFWDVVFSISSALLIVLFGVALGNIIRGVPLENSKYFLGLFGFLLNPYALAVALLALLALAVHGASYLLARTSGAVAARSRRAIVMLVPIVAVVYVALTVATFFVRSPATFGPHPVIAAGVIIAVGGLVVTRLRVGGAGDRVAFRGSSAFLVGLLLAAAATTFPYILPGFPDPTTGLDIYRYGTPARALVSALTVVIVGLALLAGYRSFVARRVLSTDEEPRDRPAWQSSLHESGGPHSRDIG